jgi:hypothetical protein
MAENIESLIARLEEGADDQGRGVVDEAASPQPFTRKQIMKKHSAFHTVNVSIEGKYVTSHSVNTLQDKKIKKTCFPVVVHVEGSDHRRVLVLCRTLGKRFWANQITGSIFKRQSKGLYSGSSSRIWAEDARPVSNAVRPNVLATGDQRP